MTYRYARKRINIFNANNNSDEIFTFLMLRTPQVSAQLSLQLCDGTIKAPVVTAGSLFPLQEAAAVFITTLGL